MVVGSIWFSFPDAGDFGQMLFQIFLWVRGPCFAILHRCFAFPVAPPLWTGPDNLDVGFTGSMELQPPLASLLCLLNWKTEEITISLLELTFLPSGCACYILTC